jgi:ribosome-associated protein
MVKSKTLKESAYLSELAIHGMQEKKGNEIVRLDLRNIFSSVSDYFVICHAD